MIFLAYDFFLMPLTEQSDELVHAVGQGGRDEAETGCVTVDQLWISATSNLNINKKIGRA